MAERREELAFLGGVRWKCRCSSGEGCEAEEKGRCRAALEDEDARKRGARSGSGKERRGRTGGKKRGRCLKKAGQAKRAARARGAGLMPLAMPGKKKRRPAQATDAEIVRGGGPPEGFSQAARGTSCTLRCRFRPTRRSRACRDWRRTRRTVRARPRSRRPRGRIPRRGCGSGTWSR